MYEKLPGWLRELLPIAILLVVIAVVVNRLPKVEVGHTKQYRHRRFLNWFPAGITYAFLYFGRYNLTAYKNAVSMSNDAYGTIDMWGAIIYGVSFLLNGPLTDRLGGRKTLLISAIGAAGANVVLGIFAMSAWNPSRVPAFAIVYAINMYFQSFGAASIVKLNAPWFHLRERGTFGGIFGVLISLGVYFAYDWTRRISDAAPNHQEWVFFAPPIVLLAMAVLDFIFVRDTPSQAGHKDFDTADATEAEDAPRLTLRQIAKKMLTNRIVLTIAFIEFCSGYLRQAVMKWYPVYAKGIGIKEEFVPKNWGMLLCVAGILGGVLAGVISDHLFNSRRGPVSAVLYGLMLVGTAVMYGTITSPALGWVVIAISLCVIGVHGMLSGTASMDFGGKKNVGVVVGIIDGFVYLGTAAQAGVLKSVLPEGDAMKSASNWSSWPLAMIPLAILGLVLASRVWNAKPQRGGAAAH